jgi:hypothetical protein
MIVRTLFRIPCLAFGELAERTISLVHEEFAIAGDPATEPQASNSLLASGACE